MASKIKVDTLETANGSGTIALSNQLSGMTSASVPSGSMLQIVQASATTRNVTTSTSYVATGYSVTITPSSTSSKILILHQGMLNIQADSQFHRATLYRGSTNLGDGTDDTMGAVYVNGATDTHAPVTFNYLDSPSTTNATTYQIYHKVSGGTGRYNGNVFKLNMIAMEIQG